MREQHPAGANAYSNSFSGHSRDENLGRRTGKGFNGVMLGDPIALVAQTVGCARQVDRVAQRIGGCEPRGDRRLVKDGKLHHALSKVIGVRKTRKRAMKKYYSVFSV